MHLGKVQAVLHRTDAHQLADASVAVHECQWSILLHDMDRRVWIQPAGAQALYDVAQATRGECIKA
jgi:hypothetical protein